MDFWTAFFANLPATILAAASFMGVILNWLKTVKVAEKVETIATETNGMKDALVDAAKKEGIAQGKLEVLTKPQPKNPYLGGD